MQKLHPGICSILIGSAFGTMIFAQEPVDFNRDIRPLLSDRCYVCHGPDQQANDSGMRLDIEELALDSGVWIAGDPESSELMVRVTSDDPDTVMPPPDSGLSLDGDEIELLRRWIEQGATFDAHWSFKSLPETIAVPESLGNGWGKNEIDTFVRRRLVVENLQPSAESHKWRWLRRVTFDLTGLPPTEEEISAFEEDHSKGAHEKVVDRLLASSHFGKHFATSWLDIARYADSYGYQSDLLSTTWPYRDWVVRAFNDNLPYDKFLLWQIAGDLLPDASDDQRLATAFNRLHRQTNEGGSVALEWRTEYVADRVNTFGTSMLGMTLECARCHDHKFDPISHQDYYNLFAYFNNIDEWGMYNDSAHVPTPSMLLPTPEQQSSISKIERQLADVNNEIGLTRNELFQREFAKWKESIAAISHPKPVAHWTLDEISDDHSLACKFDATQAGSTSIENMIVDGKIGKALQFSGDDAANFPLPHSLEPEQLYSISFWIKIPDGMTNAVILHRQNGTDVGFFGTEVSLRNGKLFFGNIRFWPGNALAVETTEPVETQRWIHVVVTSQATGDASGLSIIANGEKNMRVVRNCLTKAPAASGKGFTVGERFRSTGLKAGLIDNIQFFDRTLSKIESRLIHAADGELKPRQVDVDEFGQSELVEHFLLTHSKHIQLQRKRAKLVGELLRARLPVTEVMVMEEMKNARDAHVLARGEYDAERTFENLAVRKTPSALPPFPAEFANNRLGLARWLTSKNHSLTARVAVNRIWQTFFGTGLVSTPQDFGMQGELPSHPDLLDWLARHFVDSRWDVKRLCKKIVLSATYRQSSRCDQQLRAKDPENKLLARGPSSRLSAEQIRDLALFSSGLLTERNGGPPVSPYQPAKLWRENNSMTPAYHQSVGTELYCRSIYSIRKRTAPLPNMLNFDTSTREVCTVRRSVTNTPLQAMVLLNDVQFVEAMRVLAELAISKSDQVDNQIQFMFVRLAGRIANEAELKQLIGTFEQQKQMFVKSPVDVEKLIAVGESVATQDRSPVPLAALTVVAQLILNSDGAIYKR